MRDYTNDAADRLAAIVSDLRGTSTSLRGATGDILAGAQDLADRTTRQAAAIEESSAAIEQLVLSVSDNAKRATEARSIARSVAEAVLASGAKVRAANGAMEEITENSARISNIIGMIDDIAFQTNLLALNASVEAARAGEAGRGFGVVAVEVRRLAQNAATASSEVKTLVERSSDSVSQGATLVADAVADLELIVERVKENADLAGRMADANANQADAISEVGVAIRQMDEMTQHNAALVEETNAAIEQTEGEAGRLEAMVNRFRLGRTAKSAASAA